jgi:hypothetical protein
MTDSRLRRLFWRVADDLDYLWTLATLRFLDALAGPKPETPVDQQRSGADRKGVPRDRAVRRVNSDELLGCRSFSPADKRQLLENRETLSPEFISYSALP